MRRFYLVRHGLTLANQAGVIQDASDPLAEKGIAQAQTLGARFERIAFDTLLSSDWPRAMYTAESIAERTGHTIAASPLLRETPYPSALFGKERLGPEVAAYYEERARHTGDPHYRYGDEETFAEIRARAKAALALMASSQGTVVAVSHGNFIRKMVLSVLFGDALVQDQEDIAMQRMVTDNTGITMLGERDGVWKLLTWNDHAHLG